MSRFLAQSLLWAALWSGAFIATKFALLDNDPFSIVAIRCIGAGLPIVCFSWRKILSTRLRHFFGISFIGVLNNVGYLGLMAVSLPNLSTNTATIMTSSIPLVILVISAISGSKLNYIQWIGCIIGFLGMSTSTLFRLEYGDTSPKGIFIGLVAVGCLVLGTLLTPKLIPSGCPWTLTGIQSTCGGIVCALIALTTEGVPKLNTTSITSFLFLIMGASLVGMTLWLKLIKNFGANKASMAHFLPPIFGIFFGNAFFNEPISPAGSLLCIVGIIGLLMALKPSHHEKKSNTLL
ncbi:MAG: DMT family transporter [Corynebacterium sp.]|uniref:DMT family transporter n=1 Tax=Corynebacterium sp. TaxID=1720 RepID=UPI0026DCD38C|nr:DMT family transporter [Corynebacterium sp.]MDO4762027.1 DMT family transporter [Corynebacterium sp.]